MSDLKEIEIILEIIKKTEDVINSESYDNEQIAYYRNDVRKHVFFLQEELMEKYSDIICKYIIFPVLAYVDEKMMLIREKSNRNIQWELLHLEYYGRKDGGEYVFEIIDNITSDNIYPETCYQVMSLILHSEFYGQYYDNPYNHEFLTYKKDVDKFLKNFTNNSLVFIDSSSDKYIPTQKRNRNFLKYFLRVGIPLGLFGISVLVFLN
ncbi:DotU family type IV/VI secretion system protein [Pseudofrancisella aestuarii]|uniref:DotU family type IV/VI secretion system protein n=1 Tax=Pseudofrancisella aestuarii TaxID=2670347 RepID=A0ABV9TB54_9GAMM|nr:DotU family type IV/VI secretion system protein [Pseudofrancisella aestuarii]